MMLWVLEVKTGAPQWIIPVQLSPDSDCKYSSLISLRISAVFYVINFPNICMDASKVPALQILTLTWCVQLLLSTGGAK